MFELTLQVRKRAFKNDKGEEQEYYAFTCDFGGETFKFRVDDKEKKLLNYFLDKHDIPLEREDEKAELVKRLLSGERLNDTDKAKLRGLLIEEGGGV